MLPEPITLAFDTSAAHCAAALLSGDRILDSETRAMTKGQAEALMPMLADMLSKAGLSWNELTALGVGIGPGNFTGIRISVAAARGLALGLGIPAVGVSILEALAEGEDNECVSLVDARRGSVYAQGFNGVALVPQQMSAVDLAEFHRRYPEVPLIAEHRLDPQVIAPHMPRPDAIALIAARRAAPGVPSPAPLYLRAADAAPAKPAPALLDK